MPVEVILPRVDMDMTSARISKWHVKDGGAVTKGAALFEIETDTAAMEIEAPASGRLGKVVVGADGEAAARQPPAPQLSMPGSGARATPLARRMARDASIALASLSGSGPRGRIIAEDIRHAIAATPSTPPSVAAPSEDAIQRLYQPGSFDIQPIDAPIVVHIRARFPVRPRSKERAHVGLQPGRGD